MLLAAATAAANAVKGSAPESPSLPSPPSLPNPTEALRSSTDAASKVSLPGAPSMPTSSSDSTGLQQVCLFPHVSPVRCDCYETLCMHDLFRPCYYVCLLYDGLHGKNMHRLFAQPAPMTPLHGQGEGEAAVNYKLLLDLA